MNDVSRIIINDTVINTKNEITNEQSYFNVNESLRQIKVIRPNLITSIVSGYKKAIRE